MHHDIGEATGQKKDIEEASCLFPEKHDSELRIAQPHQPKNKSMKKRKKNNKKNIKKASCPLPEQRDSELRIAELLQTKVTSTKKRKRKRKWNNDKYMKRRKKIKKNKEKEINQQLAGDERCDNQGHEISAPAVGKKSPEIENSNQLSQASCTVNSSKNEVSNELTSNLENESIPVGDSELDTTFSLLPELEPHKSALDVKFVPAQPIFYPIWRGSLNISDPRRDYSCRMLAHLSQLACFRVSQEAQLLPKLLSSELHPCLAVWPKGFQQHGPKDDSIALYLFPERKSDEVFKRLISDMIHNDLAVRAVVTNAELLVFPSTKLPLRLWSESYGGCSLGFQRKWYLWGVFRAKQSSDECNVHPHTADKNHAETANLKTQGRAMVVS